MTTPQNHLQLLSLKVEMLLEIFDRDENGDTITDIVKACRVDIEKLRDALERQENLLQLIVKLLSKHEY